MLLCNECLIAEGLSPDRPRPTQTIRCDRCATTTRCQQVDIPTISQVFNKTENTIVQFDPPIKLSHPDDQPVKLAEFEFNPPLELRNGETASVTFSLNDGTLENVRVRVIRNRDDLEAVFKELESVGDPGIVHDAEMVRAAYAAYPDGPVTYTPAQEKKIADESFNALCSGKGDSEINALSVLARMKNYEKMLLERNPGMTPAIAHDRAKGRFFAELYGGTGGPGLFGYQRKFLDELFHKFKKFWPGIASQLGKMQNQLEAIPLYDPEVIEEIKTPIDFRTFRPQISKTKIVFRLVSELKAHEPGQRSFPQDQLAQMMYNIAHNETIYNPLLITESNEVLDGELRRQALILMKWHNFRVPCIVHRG